MIELDAGPVPSYTQGPLRFKLGVDGERVMSVRPDAGWSHRGIEKIAERVTWSAFLPFTDRVDYVSALHGNLAYALAVESLASIEVPTRASHARIVVSELSRITSHLLLFSKLYDLLGSRTLSMYVLREREHINDLFEILAGARLTQSYIRIGGVAHDLTEGFLDKTLEFLDYLSLKMDEHERMLYENDALMGRLVGVGKIDTQTAISYGLTGPNLRATGYRFDLRVDQPYCGFEKFKLDVPVGAGTWGHAGDAMERMHMRFEELRASSMLLKQVIASIPTGPYANPPGRVFKPAKGEAHAAVESPRGVFGVHVVSNGEKTPARVRLRTPSFAAVAAAPAVLSGASLEDVPAAIVSLDILASEVDR